MDGLNLIDTKNIKTYKVLPPPYYLDSCLVSNPKYTTTHLDHYIRNKTNKYTNVKSKYKIQV